MTDEYCVCGHVWVKVFNTMLYSDCYYCPNCDKVFAVTVREVTREEFEETYVSDRFEQIKKHALFKQAKRKITPDDLKKLGYLD